MKTHHLDNIIHKLKKAYSGDKIEIDIIQMLLISFEEIKQLDERLDNLSDWVHETVDYD
jgi:hypothetical protein